MFAIGETTATVANGRVTLPTAYRLKRKRVLGKWKDENTLYLSDSDKSLNYIAGKEPVLFEVEVDADDRINISRSYENSLVKIQGCISTIELVFKQRYK